MVLHSILQVLFRILLRLVFRVRVRGEKIDFTAPRMVIVANHESFLDGLLLGTFLPGKPTYVVHTLIAKIWYFRILLSIIPHVVVDTGNPMAMKKVLGFIEAGIPIVIFPEGRITVTGSLMKIYDGPSFLAARTGAVVVPVAFLGTVRTYFSRMGGKMRQQLCPRIEIVIGKPRPMVMPEAPTSRLRRRLASDQMRRIMQNMLAAAPVPQPLFDAFLDTMAWQGRGRLIIEDLRQIEESYGTLLKTTLALGRLASKFTKEGENVGVLLPTATPTLGLILGLTAMGRTPAMLNYTAGSDGIQSACRAAVVTTIITSQKFLDQAKLNDVAARLQGIKILKLEDLRPQFTLLDKLWLVLYALRFPRAATKRIDPEKPAVILFTSGSEGKPKGVVLSHRALMANVNQISTILKFTNEDKMLSPLPLFHSFGLTAGAILPLLSGCRLFLYPSPLHYRIIPELIYDRDCNILFGTNTFLTNYAKFAHPYDFFRLKYCVAGAEKLNEETRRLYSEKFGVRILEGYGATECAPVVSCNVPMGNKFGTVGMLLPNIEYRLIPVPGIESGGGLHVRGPNLMSGYLKHDRPGVLQPPESECGPGWYDTGDVVDVDANGFITIKARLKRFAKVAGEMVSLEMVESIAAKSSPRASAATTQQDANRGETIVLFTEDPNLKRDALQAAARELGAPEIAVPRKIIYVEKLPTLGTGKKDYVTMKARAAELQNAGAERV